MKIPNWVLLLAMVLILLAYGLENRYGVDDCEPLRVENDSLRAVIDRMQRSFDLCYTYKNNIHEVEKYLNK